jgi:hypothetical protein
MNRNDMKKAKITIATAVALAACVSARLLAADTSTTTALNQPKTSDPSAGPTPANGWYGPGYDGQTGYFNPALSEYNPYPYYNIVGGESYAPLYTFDLPNQNESPFNPATALTRHNTFPPSQAHHMNSLSLPKQTAQSAPAPGTQDVH